MSDEDSTSFDNVPPALFELFRTFFPQHTDEEIINIIKDDEGYVSTLVAYEKHLRPTIRRDVMALVFSIVGKTNFIFDYLKDASVEQVIANLKAVVFLNVNPEDGDFDKLYKGVKSWDIHHHPKLYQLASDDEDLDKKEKLDTLRLVIEYKNLLNIALAYDNTPVIDQLLTYPFVVDVVTLYAAFMGSGYKYIETLFAKNPNIDFNSGSTFFADKLMELAGSDFYQPIPVVPESYLLKQAVDEDHVTVSNYGDELIWLLFSQKTPADPLALVQKMFDAGYRYHEIEVFEAISSKNKLIDFIAKKHPEIMYSYKIRVQPIDANSSIDVYRENLEIYKSFYDEGYLNGIPAEIVEMFQTLKPEDGNIMIDSEIGITNYLLACYQQKFYHVAYFRTDPNLLRADKNGNSDMAYLASGKRDVLDA